jgi:lysyl-tRNA synthetase class 1
MHWADKVVKDIVSSGKYKPYWVDDMKTPSGFAHIGSMLGPVIHSAIYRALKDNDQKATLTYVFNDFDPADEFPGILKDTLEGHQGKALKMVPSPDSGFDNLADFLADDLKKSIEYLGFEAEYISSWDLYHEGKFDGVIRQALDNSEKIQDIYQKVSGSAKKESGWLPFQVICEKCGKLGTTKVYAWDGKEVSYKCEPSLVTWAKGCGHEGKISPFGGNGKLPWKVDWAAHWKVIGVTIEGAGKDHASAGGSYDIAMAICKEVFNYPEPYKLPYEFILIGGRKMSSSKGVGLKAHDLVKILPAEVARFLFVSADIGSQSNFDPDGTMAIPDLFDKYDKAWMEYNRDEKTDLARAFELSQIREQPKKDPKLFLPRFRDIANYKQLPNIDLHKKIEEIKGGILTGGELAVFKEREKYASVWLGNYAPEDWQMKISDIVPVEVKNLSELQKEYLKKLIPVLEKEDDPERLQQSLFDLVKEINIPALEAFSGIYLSFIGKERGPRAAWFLLQYPKEKVIKRLNQVVSGEVESGESENTNFIETPDYFSIDEAVRSKFPSVSVGVALIKGITVSKTGKELQSEIDEFLSRHQDLTTEVLGKFPEIISYRKLYKEMGIDWHSKRPGPEELLRRIALKKSLYSINNCVDAYNLAVMNNHVSVGAFDADMVNFPAKLQFGAEGDSVLLIGNKEPVSFMSKELVYYDQDGPYNLDFNYRDSQRTMITENTKNVWINVDGIFDATPEKVQLTLNEAVAKIIKYCGGSLEFSGIVR